MVAVTEVRIITLVRKIVLKKTKIMIIMTTIIVVEVKIVLTGIVIALMELSMRDIAQMVSALMLTGLVREDVKILVKVGLEQHLQHLLHRVYAVMEFAKAMRIVIIAPKIVEITRAYAVMESAKVMKTVITAPKIVKIAIVIPMETCAQLLTTIVEITISSVLSKMREIIRVYVEKFALLGAIVKIRDGI